MRIDINKPAPTKADIRRSIVATLLVLACPAAGWSLFVEICKPPQLYWTGTAFIVLGLLIFFGVVYAAMYADSMAVVPQEEAAELVSYCQSTPEGRAYRAQVVAQPRRFIREELLALKWWHESRHARAADKNLYSPEP